MSNNIANNSDLNEYNQIKTRIIIIFSSFNLGIYFCSLLFMNFYLKNTIYIKTKYFSFLLINSLTNLFNLLLDINSLFKITFNCISYIIQFHLVISSINTILSGKDIFKKEKDFSIKKLLLIEIFLLPIVVFPYSHFFNSYNFVINILENILIILSIICFHSYVKKFIYNILYYLNGNNKDLSNLESEELIRIYGVLYNLWSILYLFSIAYFSIRLIDILLMNKFIFIDFILSLSLSIVEEASVFIVFFGLTYINCYLNNVYNKADTIQIEDYESNNEQNSLKKEKKKKKKDIDEKNKKSKKHDKYQKLDKNQNEEENIIEIDNNENSDDKEDKNNEEEERLDNEDETKNMKAKKTKKKKKDKK